MFAEAGPTNHNFFFARSTLKRQPPPKTVMASGYFENFFNPEEGSPAWVWLEECDFDRDGFDDFQRLFFGPEGAFLFKVECFEWEGEPDHGENSWSDLDHDITLQDLKRFRYLPSHRAEILYTLRNFKMFSGLTDGQLQTMPIKYACFQQPTDELALEYYELMKLQRGTEREETERAEKRPRTEDDEVVFMGVNLA